MLWWRNEITQKMSLVSLGEQLKKEQGSQGCWRCGMSATECLEKPRGTAQRHGVVSEQKCQQWGLRLCPAHWWLGWGVESATSQSPPSLFMSILRKSFIQKSGLYEGRVGKSHGNETLSRSELPRERETFCHSKGTACPPSGGTTHSQAAQTGPLVPQGWCISVFSVTSSAGSGQREENGQLAWRKF